MADNPPPPPKNDEEQINELRAPVVDTLASSLGTMKGNQSQLNVAVNRLQSDKLQANGSTGTSATRSPRPRNMVTSCCSRRTMVWRIPCLG
jgi:hypothetical protein